MTLAKALGVEDQEPRRSSSHKELPRQRDLEGGLEFLRAGARPATSGLD